MFAGNDHPLKDTYMARQPLRTDIAAAVRRAGTSTWGCGRELQRLERHLGHGERVRRIAGARYQGKIGIAVVTDRRLLFVAEGRFRRVCDEFPYARLAFVGWRSFAGAGTITLHIGGHEAVISGVDTGIGLSIVGKLRHEMSRIDTRTQLALARQDRLYMMVEHVFSLHVPDDTAEAITDGDLADAPASGQVPVTGQAA
jgi:hypothetical protein